MHESNSGLALQESVVQVGMCADALAIAVESDTAPENSSENVASEQQRSQQKRDCSVGTKQH